ncbi:cell growth-regulating nucleolar protein [Palaemon carinicauda]|uniref:cell growth-regulating nucleolar protein n=1 Tax=Palaemon carinicauda TaxID=392227 RepID=UPI0035B64815
MILPEKAFPLSLKSTVWDEKSLHFPTRFQKPSIPYDDGVPKLRSPLQSGNDYADHKSCVSENQKYGGTNYVGKEAKGQKKQEEWVTLLKEKITNTKDINPELKNLFNRLLQFDNIPRKKNKFMNFLKNSHVKNEGLAEEAWKYFEEVHSMLKTTPNLNPSQSNPDSQKMEKDCSATKVDSLVSTEDTLVEAHRKSKRERKEERRKKQTKVQKKDKKRKHIEDQDEGQDSEKPKKKKKKVAGEEDEKSNQENVKPENKLDESMVQEEEEAECTSNHIPFKWNKAICTVLKDAPEEGMKMKHLKRKLFSLYMESKSEAAHIKSDIEINALITKKLGRRTDKYVVVKERVKLRATTEV